MERDITNYETMWNHATTGWQTTSAAVSQTQYLSWLPNPVVTGTGSRDHFGRGGKAKYIFLCVPARTQLWVLTTEFVFKSSPVLLQQSFAVQYSLRVEI